MKTIAIISIIIGLFFGTSSTAQNSELMKSKPSIYDISITDLSGEKIDLSKFKGKKILIVNTAS